MTKDDSRIVKDPICGKDVDTLRARAVGIFGGVTYYFCSADCKAKYQDPRQQPRAPVEPASTAGPAKVLVATDSPKRKAEKAAEKARAEKADPSIKVAKSDKSGRFAKVDPAPAVAKVDAKPDARVEKVDAKEASGRVIEVDAEPSSHFEQAEELTPIPTSRRRFPLVALLLLALLVAGGVVLFTLKHK
jgi:YHS domain-containing protein